MAILQPVRLHHLQAFHDIALKMVEIVCTSPLRIVLTQLRLVRLYSPELLAFVETVMFHLLYFLD